MAWTLILDTTDASPSAEFTAGSGQPSVFCDIHAGATWTLEYHSPGGEWIAQDTDITDTGWQRFYAPLGITCRFTGGTTGDRLYVQGAQ